MNGLQQRIRTTLLVCLQEFFHDCNSRSLMQRFCSNRRVNESCSSISPSRRALCSQHALLAALFDAFCTLCELLYFLNHCNRASATKRGMLYYCYGMPEDEQFNSVVQCSQENGVKLNYFWELLKSDNIYIQCTRKDVMKLQLVIISPKSPQD